VSITHFTAILQLTPCLILCSLLSYLIQPKTLNTPIAVGTDSQEKEHTGRFSGAISNSIVSIGDLFKDIRDGPGSKSVKFPEKLLKVLEQKLQNIAMGKDPACVGNLLCHHEIGLTNQQKIF
jgi:hypothetical protein